MLSPTYTILIDWDSDGGLMIGDFEYDNDGWSPQGTVLPAFARSTVRSYHADSSALITWGTGGTGPALSRVLSGLTSGVAYALSAWIWVPTGSPNLRWAVVGGSTGTASSTKDAWVEITLSFTATAAIHTVQIQPSTSPTAGQQAWVDLCRITSPGEDVTSRFPEKETLAIAYGRDQARAFSPTRPGTANLELDNESRDYSPENASSPLAGKLGPGRDVMVQATYNSRAYTLYRGKLDDYEVNPNKGEWSVNFTALDGLATLKTVDISTALYPGLRTGEAIGRVLDAVGWTGGRDIDSGGTTIRWWWEEDTNAYTALEKIVASEGPGAFMTIGPSGQFIFRDRHHRLVRTESTTVQATFRDSGAEPWFEAPFELDYGWRDIVNYVTFKVEERAPAVVEQVVWSDTNQFSLAAGETRVLSVSLENPTHLIATPTSGATAGSGDFVVPSGSVTVTLSRNSGQSLNLNVTAGGAGATVLTAQLRGYPVTAARTVVVAAEDAASIAKYGRRSYGGDSSPWLNRYDAQAVADLVLGQRAERLPIVQLRIVNGSDTALTQQLQRDLSDRIRVIDAETGLDASFYADQIKHSISRNGVVMETVFGCERVATAPSSLFTFDHATLGKFGTGTFAPSGFDDPNSVMRFDHATQGKFNTGAFGT